MSLGITRNVNPTCNDTGRTGERDRETIENNVGSAENTRAMMQGDGRRDYEMRATRETSIAVRCIYLGGDNQGTHAEYPLFSRG